MTTTERVTVSLPAEMIERIDRLEKNRSRFIAMAVAQEIDRRRRVALDRSLAHPHPEVVELADTGLHEWASSLPEGDGELVDMAAGRAVRWVEGRGWIEG